MLAWLSSSVLVFVSASSWALVPPSIFDSGQHCVAYKVTKTTFFLANSSVMGKNCDVSAQVLPEVGGTYHIEVNVPIRGFSSGDMERDKDVMGILKVHERPDLTFKTKTMKAEQWRNLFEK